ncbi:MAG: 16S rRNA (cytidine(1402)-2'-O)-methyltransferase [Gammaproteobacteria bacterium]|nr:16S rRNA (cytidine(1402)-2'-O)-methyltransferase [Gammaproteobacteria bacterium]
MTHKQNLGVLYIVATPIGNLQDITLRAIEVLQKVDCIAAEDTRHSLPLLKQFSIHTAIISLHEYNERERTNELLKRLQNGESIALISDAGTPLISDPGYFLVREVRELGIRVIPIPGACAAITALCAAGLPTDKFVFEGFLPVKSKQRKDALTPFKHEMRTVIFYESPRRLLECLEDIQEVLGNERKIIIGRELTKLFETIQAGTATQLISWINADNNQTRGEIVILLEGVTKKQNEEIDFIQEVLSLLINELPLKQAVDLTMKITKGKKNVIYQLALQMKK